MFQKVVGGIVMLVMRLAGMRPGKNENLAPVLFCSTSRNRGLPQVLVALMLMVVMFVPPLAHGEMCTSITRDVSALHDIIFPGYSYSVSCQYLDAPYDYAGLEVHAGIDFPHAVGTPIVSPVSGRVELGGDGLGRVTIVLDNSWRINFLHLDTRTVANGQITAGTTIGTVGKTGCGSCGSHLHVEIRPDATHGTGAIGGPSCGGYCTTKNITELTLDPFLLRPSLKFSPTSNSELLRYGGRLAITVSGSNQYPGKVVLYNGPNAEYSVPRAWYQSDIAIAAGNWVSTFLDTSINVNLFNPSAYGNSASSSGSPAISDKLLYPVKIKVIGGLDPISGLTPTLGESYYPFADVKPDHWASCYIMKLWRKGIASGQGGLFRPSDKVSRAEFLKMSMKGAFPEMSFNSTDPIVYFKDSDFASWQIPYVNVAVQNSLVQGSWCPGSNTDKCFYPNAPISRSEAVTILVRVFGLQQNGAAISFQDTQDSLVSVAASNYGNSDCGGGNERIISGFKDGTFHPDDPITRDQAAKIIAVAVKK